MSRMRRIGLGGIFLIAFVIPFLTGCAGKPIVRTPIHFTSDSPNWPDSRICQRFSDYWDFRRVGDSASSWNYEAPHVREMVIRGRYDAFTRVRDDIEWKEIEILEIRNITPQLIEIGFYINVALESGNREKIYYKDQWLYLSGEWYHVMKDSLLIGK